MKAEAEEIEEEEDTELELALAKARRHKLAEQQRIPKVCCFISEILLYIYVILKIILVIIWFL